MAKVARSDGWRAAFRLARRETRGGLDGFRVFALALALGVAAIAAVGSLSAAFQTGLETEKRRLLGGDLEVTSIHGPLAPEALALLSERGAVSQIADVQTMGRAVDGTGEGVVQFKGVDAAYPLIGEVRLDSDTPPAEIYAFGDGAWGAAADPALFQRFGLDIGDRIRLGDAVYELRAQLRDEPDRATAGFMLGPRVLASLEGAEASGLLAEGGIVNRAYRVDLSTGTSRELLETLRADFPDESWRIRTAANAARGLERLLENLDVFLTMVGLSALVIGGVGAANAVRAYMDRKIPTVATLKCLGASGDFILKVYVVQVLIVAAGAVAVGLAIGASAPYLAAFFFGDRLPFEAALGVYPDALLRAAAYGFLAALAFALWPLAEARQTPAARLFRSTIDRDRRRPSRRDAGLVALAAALFAGLAILLAEDRMFAIWFAAGGLAAYGALRAAAGLLVVLARRLGRPRRPALRMALANLTRPGSGAAGVTVSLGLGLTLLAAVSLIDDNLTNTLARDIESQAPALYFADIPFDGVATFDEIIAEQAPDAEAMRFPMLRAGVLRLDGVPVADVEGARRSPWVRQNDWGVSYAGAYEDGFGEIRKGDWWAEDYSGPPLISLDDWQAEIFGLDVGDTMTLNIGGRAVTGEIANLRDVDWGPDGLNFVAIFAPGTLEAARPTFVGSVSTPDLETEQRVYRAVADALPNAAIITTRDVIETVRGVLADFGMAIRALTGVTIAAGIIVLLGAIAADYQRKRYDAMVMKTIGADRARIFAAHALEYAALGLGPAALAVALGGIAAWYVVAERMEIAWRLSPAVAISVVSGAAIVTIGLGLAAAWRILGARPWPVLRSD